MRELVVCAIEVQDLFGYPYTKHLREGLHNFIHALPVNQIEVYLLHYIPLVK
jgi:hypothetical protein